MKYKVFSNPVQEYSISDNYQTACQQTAHDRIQTAGSNAEDLAIPAVF
jgi:hypothetical protein